MKFRLLRLVAVGNQSADDADPAVHRTTVTRMLNLRDVLRLVNHGFDNRELASEQFVAQSHQSFRLVASMKLMPVYEPKQRFR